MVPLPVEELASIVVPGWLATAGAVLVFVLLAARPLVGICALLAFYPLMHQVPRTPVPGLNAETILVSFAMILTLARSNLRFPPLRVTGIIVAIAAVITLGWVIANTWISVPFEAFSPWSRFRAVKSHLFTSLLFFVGYWWTGEARGRRALLESVSLGLALAAVGVLIDFANGSQRPAGFYDNANMPGEYLAVFSLLPLHHALSGEIPRVRRFLHLLAYLLAAAGAVATLSRSAWIALVVGHLVYLGLMHPRRMVVGALAGALAALLLGPVAYPTLPEPLRERFESTFDTGGVLYRTGVGITLESSAASRVAAHRAGLHMFLDSPIWGHGLDSFKLLVVDYGASYGILRPISAHSTPLRIATENGLIGLVAFAWLAVALLAIGWRLWSANRGEPRAYGALLLGVAAASLVSNLFHAGFLGSWLYSSVFWSMFGAVAGLEHATARERAPAELQLAVPAWRRRALLQRAPSALR